jgi:hypothetical protein
MSEQEPQVTLTPAPITHVWATISETEFERKQRRVACLRAERGLARYLLTRGAWMRPRMDALFRRIAAQ